MKEFLWIPGDGYDGAALKRMQMHVVMPSEPMGEAWFMGQGRFIFDYLSEDIKKIPVKDLMKPLEEIASGTNSFGYHDEWKSWFHYLLGQLIPRSHDHYSEYLLEYLITGFITQYPDGINNQPYKGFQTDVLNTLGKCIMDEECWNCNNITKRGILWPSNKNPNKVWYWWNASGYFSSSLFFCLKYLPTEIVSRWFKSVLEIESPFWMAQLFVWLVGVNKILKNEIKQPSEFSENDRPYVAWPWSHCITGNNSADNASSKYVNAHLIPEANRTSVLRVIEEEITEALYFEWLSSISEHDYLESELAEIPDRFASLYIYQDS